VDPDAKPLNPKEARFVEEYMVDLNAAGAARRTGYPVKSAKECGYELLTRPHIRAAVVAARAALSEKLNIDVNDIARELVKMGFANLADYFCLTSENGDPYIDLTACTRAQLAGLVELTVEDYVEGRGEDARQVKRIKVKLADKKGSLSLLSDLLGFSPKRSVELSGSVKVEKAEDGLA
jgi:phage terminase small subunit